MTYRQENLRRLIAMATGQGKIVQHQSLELLHSVQCLAKLGLGDAAKLQRFLDKARENRGKSMVRDTRELSR